MQLLSRVTVYEKSRLTSLSLRLALVVFGFTFIAEHTEIAYHTGFPLSGLNRFLIGRKNVFVTRHEVFYYFVYRHAKQG
jgi:hypothetical protein